MALARTLMVQGTASNVGKSLLVTALCRYFTQQGLKVAPFKGLNMALNAHVTADGFELARAQAVQAEACGIEPTVEMNPLLLKPEGNMSSQVILLGKPSGTRSARELFATGLDIKGEVVSALERLREKYELVIIEGAGSPAEINLRSRDVANMFIAQAADAPVILASDIDRGGVFASFVGTLQLLTPEERARVKGFFVNKFRGDVSLLQPGIEWLEQYTGVPSFGVLPHLGALRIAEEDSLNVDARVGARAERELRVVVLRLPRISNHDEFQPFEHEPDVSLIFTDEVEDALAADLLIVPGTKSTIADLEWLRSRGLDLVIRLRALRGQRVLGICGGCQMLGQAIADPHHVESPRDSAEGLGLLALNTQFTPRKNTVRVKARKASDNWLFAGVDAEVPGYFIHAGLTASVAKPALETRSEQTWQVNGAVSEDGHVIGTMVHGLFESDAVRHALLDGLRTRRGLAAVGERARWDREAEYDRLAQMIRDHANTNALDTLVR
jgi:adenosylcobyric acid synthase